MYGWIYLFAAFIGFATTLAEPALIAVAFKANQASRGTIRPWGLRLVVALGVAAGIHAGRRSSPSWTRVSERAVWIVFGLVTAAILASRSRLYRSLPLLLPCLVVNGRSGSLTKRTAKRAGSTCSMMRLQ